MSCERDGDLDYLSERECVCACVLVCLCAWVGVCEVGEIGRQKNAKSRERQSRKNLAGSFAK